jgi:hypothetical protein
LLNCRFCTACSIRKERSEITGKPIHVLYVVSDSHIMDIYNIGGFIDGWKTAKGLA